MKKVDTLISKEQLELRITELAEEIENDYKGKPITLICILKGGVVFMVDLARKIPGDVRFDFMDVSSYGDKTISQGQVKINKDLEHSIEGKDIILIEDIIDTGKTLSYLVKYLGNKNPSSLKICTLLDKPDRRVVGDVTPDYVGFTIPDEFVVGYGLDFAQQYRNLSFIGVIKDN